MDHFSCSGVSFLDLFIFLTTAVSGSQRIYPKFPSITKIFNLHRTILPLLLLLLRDRLLLLSFHLCVQFKYTAMKVGTDIRGPQRIRPYFPFFIRISSKVCICSETYLHLLGGLT